MSELMEVSKAAAIQVLKKHGYSSADNYDHDRLLRKVSDLHNITVAEFDYEFTDAERALVDQIREHGSQGGVFELVDGEPKPNGKPEKSVDIVEGFGEVVYPDMTEEDGEEDDEPLETAEPESDASDTSGDEPEPEPEPVQFQKGDVVECDGKVYSFMKMKGDKCLLFDEDNDEMFEADPSKCSVADQTEPKKRGRPKGSKNLSVGKASNATAEPESDASDVQEPKKRRGRPKGSKNKATSEKESSTPVKEKTDDTSEDQTEKPKRKGGPGRPKGSKNKPKEDGPNKEVEKFNRRKRTAPYVAGLVIKEVGVFNFDLDQAHRLMAKHGFHSEATNKSCLTTARDAIAAYTDAFDDPEELVKEGKTI